MRNINTIFRREVAGFFNSPMAYIFLVIFAIVNGYFFTNTFFLFGQSDLRVLFDIVPLVYLFFIPAVSMGLIAREHNLGTMEIISTLPINNFEFVLGKFFAALSLILLGLFATSIHFFTLIFVGSNVDYGAIFSGYLGLALMGATYAAIGTYSSSVTENQVVSFIVAVFIHVKYYLRGGVFEKGKIKCEVYDGPLKEPVKDFFYFVNLLICKFKFIYLKISKF